MLVISQRLSQEMIHSNMSVMIIDWEANFADLQINIEVLQLNIAYSGQGEFATVIQYR